MSYRDHIGTIFARTINKKKLPPKNTSEEERPEQEWVLCDRVEAFAVPWQQRMPLWGYSICVGGLFSVCMCIYIYTYVHACVCILLPIHASMLLEKSLSLSLSLSLYMYVCMYLQIDNR